MIRLLIFALIIVAFLWLFLGYMAAKAEIRFQRTVVGQHGISKGIVLLVFLAGLLGWLAEWIMNEDEMREVHNLPPRQFKSKRLRKSWTERFFGE